MKRMVFVLVLLSLLLAGCGASDEPADTPTQAPTDTRAPPTATPKPTATPTSEPTATPEPTTTHTPEPTLGPPKGEVIDILMEAALNEYHAKYFRWAIGISTYILENYLPNHPEIDVHPEFYFLRSHSYATIGDFENAIHDLEIAVNLPRQDALENQVDRINNLCWYLAITGDPEKALPYCEEAVRMADKENVDQTARVLDSIGLAYGMLGRMEESIAAFKEMFNLLGTGVILCDICEPTDRGSWIEAMESGEDPFTPEVLEALRQETIDPAALPEGEVRTEYTFAYFTEFLKQDGFEFYASDTTFIGPVDYYTFDVGSCGILVGVIGDEEEFYFTSLTLVGCTQEQMRVEIGWFGRLMLLADPYQNADDCTPLGQFFAWQITEIDSLINGDILETSEFELDNITFMAQWLPEGDMVLVYAVLKN